MCVILYKKANHLIERWRLESAVKVNPDGWGYSIPDGEGKLFTRRQYDARGNNIDIIQRTIEKYKNKEMYIHLRFKTQGELSLLNCHPFTVLTKKKHGIDIQFMHNGSITNFNDRKDPRSDTKQFVDIILTPLLERILTYQPSPEQAIFDDLLPEILEKYAGYSNKFVLLDGYGANLIINEKQGKDFDWGWASNEYSFDRFHRDPVKPPANNAYQGGQNNQGNFSKLPPWKNGKTIQDNGHTENFRETQEQNKTNLKQHEDAIARLNDRSVIIFSSKEHNMPEETPRLTFAQIMDLNDLSEISCFNESDIADLVKKEPDFACLLIQDLRDTLFNKKQAETKITETKKNGKIIELPNVPLIAHANEKAMPRIN